MPIFQLTFYYYYYFGTKIFLTFIHMHKKKEFERQKIFNFWFLMNLCSFWEDLNTI